MRAVTELAIVGASTSAECDSTGLLRFEHDGCDSGFCTAVSTVAERLVLASSACAPDYALTLFDTDQIGALLTGNRSFHALISG